MTSAADDRLKEQAARLSSCLHAGHLEVLHAVAAPFEESPSIRLTYDRGALEIMSPLLEHESFADLFHSLWLF